MEDAEMFVMKGQLERGLGEKFGAYWHAFKSFVLGKITKKEFDDYARITLTPSHVKLHNRLVIAILRSAAGFTKKSRHVIVNKTKGSRTGTTPASVPLSSSIPKPKPYQTKIPGRDPQDHVNNAMLQHPVYDINPSLIVARPIETQPQLVVPSIRLNASELDLKLVHDPYLFALRRRMISVAEQCGPTNVSNECVEILSSAMKDFVKRVLREAMRSKEGEERQVQTQDLFAALTLNPSLVPPELMPLTLEKLLCCTNSSII